MIPQDAALPQLATVLDARAMAPVLAAEVHGLQLRHCEVERVKWRPGRSCSIVYRLDLLDPASGRGLEQRVAARACPPGTSARRHEQALARPLRSSAAGPALSHLPALGLVAHWLPNDARLDVLPLLADDPALRGAALPAIVATLTEGRGRLVGHRCTLVHLVPELRVCARVDLRIEQGSQVLERSVYAKADTERDGAATQAAMSALWAAPARREGRLHLPQPLGLTPGTALHWQAALPGRPLQDLDLPPGAAETERMGRALAGLHATPVPGLPLLDAAAMSTRIDETHAMLCCAEPQWQAPLARLRPQLLRGARALAGLPAVTLHGDLHPGNVMVDGDAVGFIDLDSLQAGPAALELGGWVADALARAVLLGLPLQAAASDALALVDAAGTPPDPALLAWSTACDLVCRRAYRAAANLKPGRWQTVPRLLALAQALLDTGSVRTACTAQREAA